MTTTATTEVFKLPDLGEGLTEAEIVRWLVAVGDQVAVDQPVVEVETAKSVVDIPSPHAGRVAALHGNEGDTHDVGTPLITIDRAGDVHRGSVGTADPVVTQSHQPTPVAGEAYREEERAGSGNVLIGYGTANSGRQGRRRRPRGRTQAMAPAAQVGGSRRPPLVVSPLVRRLAHDSGIALSDVTPTGNGGLITRADVTRALTEGAKPVTAPVSPSRTPPDGTGERRTPLTDFRKAVAATLSRSRSEIPEATVWVDIDATALWELRETTRLPDDPGPGLLAYIARFVVAGLNRYPVLNARLDTQHQEIVENEHVHLGLAVQAERGLVVPAVRFADQMTTDQLDAAIRDVTARAREGRSTSKELASGTFTLNNYGSFRVDGSAAIINHPQVAILGIGRIIDRPWVVDGELCVRKITQMSFVFDHRVCDGGTAAGFMRLVADAVENPATAVRNL